MLSALQKMSLNFNLKGEAEKWLEANKNKNSVKDKLSTIREQLVLLDTLLR